MEHAETSFLTLFGHSAAMMKLISYISLLLALALDTQANGEALRRDQTRELIKRANRKGPYLGVVIPNLFEMNPLLQHPSFIASDLVIDYAGRRFRFGTIEGKQVILVMTGLAMLNAGITTQLLLSEFDIEGVVHYGIAGNADPGSHVGDVTIPRYWSHTGLWSWQRHGLGPEDPLPLEAFGDYTRTLGSIKFADFATNKTRNGDNLLNSLWYQFEEVFPVDGTPEQRQHVFWVPADTHYLHLAGNLTNLRLEGCINSTTCLEHTPIVKEVKAGTSTSIYLDNAAYRSFIHEKFEITAVEMESAAVALVCYQHKVPFIVIRALSDMAGGGTAESNEADLFTPLAANNSVKVVVEFIKLLSL